jgi:hypothetical protein
MPFLKTLIELTFFRETLALSEAEALNAER